MIDDFDFSPFIPMLIGLSCNLLALLFWFIWPKKKASHYGKRISWPGYILHFFHPLAWVFFGMAAFIQPRQPIAATILAVLGGIIYLVFIVILAKA